MVFVFMTPCCDLGHQGGVLRETTADNNSEKPSVRTAWIPARLGGPVTRLSARGGPRSPRTQAAE